MGKWIALVTILLVTPALLGQGVPAGGPDDIIEMHGVDKLETLLDFVDRMTEKTIVYDAAMKTNKVKICGGKTEILRKHLLPFIETMLEMNGYTMTEAPGNVLRVIPSKGTGEPIVLRVGRDEDLPNTAAMITQVVTLKHADPIKVSTLIKPMVTPGKGGVAIYDTLATLFITTT